MFTGIVQCTGVVADVRVHAGGVRLRIQAGELAQQAKIGDSICVSGICLTVAALTSDQFEFDVIRETLDKTVLGALSDGDRVNLEPSLRAGDRLDGHFVQGHVDGTATVQRVVATPSEYVVWLRPQRHLLPYIIPKGSVAIDGVSLTVAALDSDLFSVALIPTTLERTTLGRLQAGDDVNIESDMMVRTVIHYLQRLLGRVDEGGEGRDTILLPSLTRIGYRLTPNAGCAMNGHREQSSSPPRPLIGLTMGDPCGIGPETIVKALADPEVRRLGRFVIYGIDEVLNAAADAASIRPFWFHVPAEDSSRVDSGVVVVDHCEYPAALWLTARPTAEGGKCSLRFFDSAIDAARRGLIDAIVTGPIHKVSWQLAGSKFAGHTDKLGDAFNTRRYAMAFVGGGLRLALATVHVGLLEIRDRLSIGSVFQPIDLLHDALVRWFGVEAPRIAVLGLNPHAGEEGRFGDEERRIIGPAMQMAAQHGINVEGPFPADSFFANYRRLRFDGVVAMYHDQGLIPIKMLAFDSAVNLTLGLPVIRTSVDHGTAFDIAGTNSADPGSMKAAIRLAVEMAACASTGGRATKPEDRAVTVSPA